VTALKVYQIGVGSFGKYGFEKLIELENEFETVDVELKGVCDSDFKNWRKPRNSLKPMD